MLLSVENIYKNYGMKELLKDVSLYLNEGDKIGIIGINGTGKSTLEYLRAMRSLTAERHGLILIYK